MRRTLAWLTALAIGWSPLARADNPNATLVYYNLAGNQTLDPADPQNNSSYAHDSLLAIFDTLIRLDDAGNPGPGLAESWTRSPMLDEITLVLRQGASFHDGSPVTAATVAQSFERNTALDRRAGASVREAMGLISAVEVVEGPIGGAVGVGVGVGSLGIGRMTGHYSPEAEIPVRPDRGLVGRHRGHDHGACRLRRWRDGWRRETDRGRAVSGSWL